MTPVTTGQLPYPGASPAHRFLTRPARRITMRRMTTRGHHPMMKSQEVASFLTAGQTDNPRFRGRHLQPQLPQNLLQRHQRGARSILGRTTDHLIVGVAYENSQSTEPLPPLPVQTV